MSHFPTQDRVCWREGICVTSHHFQLQEHYFDAQVHRLRQLIAPLAWGVSHLQIDQSALSRGQFSILELEAILPDGTSILLHQQGDHQVQPRSLSEHFGETHPSRLVYVAIPAPSPQSPRFSSNTHPARASTGDPPLRYQIEERELRNHSSPPNKTRVEVLVPQFRLLFEGEDQDGYACLPIARISRRHEEGYRLDSSYLPPSISLQATPSLRATLHRLLETALSCYRRLYARRPQKQDMAERDLLTYLRLGAISTSLPELEHCAKDPRCSPTRAYALLCRMAGQLWPLFDHSEPIKVPALCFQDLSSALHPLIDQIFVLLERSVASPPPFVEIALKHDGQGRWTAIFDDPKLASAERFLLSLRSSQSPEQIREFVQTRCKIASPSQLQGVLDSAIAGARLHAPNEAAGIELRRGEIHLEFDRHDPYWRDLFQERAISLYSEPHELTQEHQPSVLALLPRPPTP